MHTLRQYNAHAKWFCEVVALIVFITIALTILILLLLRVPKQELKFLMLRTPHASKNEERIYSHLKFEPGHTRTHEELCAASPRLVILVTSAPSHALARDAIRSTWGRSARRAKIPLAFVLGAAPEHLREALDGEDAEHADLIQGRFHDSYRNMALKTLSMLEWIAKYCPATTRVLKTDDDIFINIHRLLAFTEGRERRDATNTIWGEVLTDVAPIRDARFKYFVPSEEYANGTYPPYALGHGYLMTGDVAGVLLHAARGARLLRLEDVFATGVLAESAGVRREHVRDLALRPAEHACDLRAVTMVHDLRFHEQFDRYAKLLDPDIACPEQGKPPVA